MDHELTERAYAKLQEIMPAGSVPATARGEISLTLKALERLSGGERLDHAATHYADMTDLAREGGEPDQAAATTLRFAIIDIARRMLPS